MAKHIPNNDIMARERLETAVTDVILDINANAFGDSARDIAKAVAGAFPFVEYDRRPTNVDGVALRRVVVTGEWEVDPEAATGDRP